MPSDRDQNKGNVVFSLSEIAKGRMPYSYEAEAFCLGAMLIDNTIMDGVFAKLDPEDFYEIRHQIVAKSLLSLTVSKSGQPVDLITFPDTLRSQGKLDEIGGVTYLTELVETVTSLDNIDYYINIIKENADFRNLARVGSRIISLALDKKHAFDEVLDRSQQFLYDLTRNKYRDFKDFKTILRKLLEEMELNYKNRDELDKKIGIQTGFKFLDDVLLGIQPSNLMIIGGRPAMGKTAFALSIIENIAITSSNRVGVGFFSLEMTSLELATRLLCSRSKVPMERVRKNAFDDNDWAHIFRAAEQMASAKIFIDDTPRISMQELSFKAKKMVEMGANIIFLDYLQLMASSEGGDNVSREQFVASISRGLKILARELEVPVVALTQLNRGLEAREKKTPRLSDIRESGSIEQDADIVCFVHRDVVYADKDNKEEIEKLKNKATIVVAKNRHGKTDDVHLSFQENFARFDNLDVYN